MKVIIIGGGQVGAYIAKLLLSNHYFVRVLENRASVLANLVDELPPEVVIAGSGTDLRFLEMAGVSDADVLVAVTGADETNLVASTLAKMEYGVPRVIARVNNPKNTWLFNAGMGVDVAVNQADLLAHLVVSEMDLKDVLTLMKLNGGKYSIIQFSVESHSSAISRSVKDLGIPSNALLIAITRKEETIIPNGNTIIFGGDNVMVFADETDGAIICGIFGQCNSKSSL